MLQIFTAGSGNTNTKMTKTNRYDGVDCRVFALLFISASPVWSPLYKRPFLLIKPSSLNSSFVDKLLLSCNITPEHLKTVKVFVFFKFKIIVFEPVGLRVI